MWSPCRNPVARVDGEERTRLRRTLDLIYFRPRPRRVAIARFMSVESLSICMTKRYSTRTSCTSSPNDTKLCSGKTAQLSLLHESYSRFLCLQYPTPSTLTLHLQYYTSLGTNRTEMSSTRAQEIESSGPEERLFCTVSECKRSSDLPFNRKGNLHEHLRRVHGITNTNERSQLRNTTGATTKLIESTTGHTGCGLLDTSAGSRVVSGGLKSEIQRARAANLEKDERIRQLKETGDRREECIAGLEARLARETDNNLLGLGESP
jgi:hypothetical protein